MVTVELRQHVQVVYNLKNPILELYHRVNCLQFEIHQIANETLVQYVPVDIRMNNINVVQLYFFKKCVLFNGNDYFSKEKLILDLRTENRILLIAKAKITSNVFKHNALAGARGSKAATRSHTLILPSYAPLTMRFESNRMQRTSSS